MCKRLFCLLSFILMLVIVQPVTQAQYVENLALNPSFESDENWNPWLEEILAGPKKITAV